LIESIRILSYVCIGVRRIAVFTVIFEKIIDFLIAILVGKIIIFKKKEVQST